MKEKKYYAKQQSRVQVISVKNILLFLVMFLQISSLINRTETHRNQKPSLKSKIISENSHQTFINNALVAQEVVLPLMFSTLLVESMSFAPVTTSLILTVINLPVVHAGWFDKALKKIFSPGDYLMPTDSFEKLLEKARQVSKDVVRDAGLEARMTVQETGKVLDGVIEKVDDKANKLLINFANNGKMLIEKVGDELRITADDVLKKVSHHGQVVISAAGLEARMTIQETGVELRSVITHAGNEIRSLSYEIPRLARLTSEAFIVGAVRQLKQELIGSTELQRIAAAIDNYMREHRSPNLVDLLNYVKDMNHLHPAEKAQLYAQLIKCLNVPEIQKDDREKLILLIGATAYNDEMLFHHVDFGIINYQKNYTAPILEVIPSKEIKAVLESGNEQKFLGYFGMLPAPQDVVPDGSVPVGAIFAFPEHVLPSDFVECDGREYSVENMKDLYAIIGKRYGYRYDAVSKKEYFNIPDYRGYFLRGWSHDVTMLGSTQEDSTRMPNRQFNIEHSGSHTHVVNSNGRHGHGMKSSGNHQHGFRGDIGGWHDGGQKKNSGKAEYLGPVKTDPEGNHTHELYEAGSHDHSMTENGDHVHALSGGDEETRPRNKNVKFMIKYQSLSINLHKQIVELRQELKDTRESMQNKYMFFSAAAVTTGLAVAATALFLRR